jgi:iron complex transport system substrate-binding protein
MGDVFRVAGAKNVVSGGSSDYPRLSAEAVISLNPQCLFLTEEQPKPGMVAARPGWRQVAAVKAQRIYTIDASIVSRPGPRIAQAIERIETDLYSPADRRR